MILDIQHNWDPLSNRPLAYEHPSLVHTMQSASSGTSLRRRPRWTRTLTGRLPVARLVAVEHRHPVATCGASCTSAREADVCFVPDDTALRLPHGALGVVQAFTAT